MDKRNLVYKYIGIFIPIIILMIIVDSICLIDLYRRQNVRFKNKWIWVVIILIQFPIGPLIYTIFKENKN